MLRIFENSGLYSMVEGARMAISPARSVLKILIEFARNPFLPYSYTYHGKFSHASMELIERITRHYPKPEFGIHHTEVNGKEIKIHQENILDKSFCKLIHFKKETNLKQEKMLIVAPMSGHHATLLRGTVQGLLPHFDVYITDWIDACRVPPAAGNFNFDDYVTYVTEFIEHLGKNVTVMGVCQPTVPCLAAISIMAAEKNPYTPAAMILIGGPIDSRVSPTKVNDLATTKSLNWFEQNLITRVPANYPGFTRQVYPGFLQLMGFMQMNMKRHLGEHMKLYKHLIVGDGENADHHRKFYNEYLSVMDIPAEFYLQTLQIVFQDHSLPRGTLVCGGKKVKPEMITDTALMVIEGELDDISGLGQTKAAIDICKNIPKEKKLYHLQEGVGHYGVFNGKSFTNKIVPAIVEFCSKNVRTNSNENIRSIQKTTRKSKAK